MGIHVRRRLYLFYTNYHELSTNFFINYLVLDFHEDYREEDYRLNNQDSVNDVWMKAIKSVSLLNSETLQRSNFLACPGEEFL